MAYGNSRSRMIHRPVQCCAHKVIDVLISAYLHCNRDDRGPHALRIR